MQQGREIPEWISRLLEQDFSEGCIDHEEEIYLRKYCMTCDKKLCKDCIRLDQHTDHGLIKIYRQMYQAVVPLTELEMHFDCAKIQPFKCNNEWVLYLRTNKWTTTTAINGDACCNVCKKIIPDPDQFCYCSLRCKVKEMTTERRRPVLEVPQVGTSQGADETEASEEPPQPKSFRKRPRKGVPHRAPFF